MKWRMDKPCVDCPFNSSGPGLRLRKSLAATRWREIRSSLIQGNHFTCHKTTHEAGNGSNLICAGAIEWQEERGVTSQLQRIMERCDAMKDRLKAS